MCPRPPVLACTASPRQRVVSVATMGSFHRAAGGSADSMGVKVLFFFPSLSLSRFFSFFFEGASTLILKSFCRARAGSFSLGCMLMSLGEARSECSVESAATETNPLQVDTRVRTPLPFHLETDLLFCLGGCHLAGCAGPRYMCP